MNEESGAPAPQNDQVIRATRRATLMAASGAVMVLIAVYFAATMDDLSGIGGLGTAAVVLLIMGIWKMRNAYVTFHGDHFETRLAPAGGWHTVLYSEVTRAELKGIRLLTVEYRKHNVPPTARPKRLKIRLTEMQPDERDACVAGFRARLPGPVFQEIG